MRSFKFIVSGWSKQAKKQASLHTHLLCSLVSAEVAQVNPGGNPELCFRRHAKRDGEVYARQYALRVRKSCPECSMHVLCYVGKCGKGFV